MAKRGVKKTNKPSPRTKGAKRPPKPGPGQRSSKRSAAGDQRGGKGAPPKKTPRARPAETKARVNLPPREEGERLQKLLAAAGVASRRECEQLIQEGRVEVDGQTVTELGTRVDPFKAKIVFDGEPLPRLKRLYFAVHKPEGVVCTARDPSGRPRVTDLLPPDVGRVFNVGRLDMASEGLILLTNDGELANRLTHPRHGVEKIYHVQVAGVPTPETFAEMRKGVYLAEGKAHFVNARLKSRRKSGSVLEVVLDEGRNREIRRVLARVGHKVQRLTRVAVGPVRLGELPAGAYRPLTPEEVRALRAAASGETSGKAPVGKRRKPSAGRKPGQGGAPPRAAKKKPARSIIGDPVPSDPPTGKKRPPKKGPPARGRKTGGQAGRPTGRPSGRRSK